VPKKTPDRKTYNRGSVRPGPPPSPAETRAAGLRLLGRRDHSSQELARKLSRRGHREASVQAVLARFREAGWLDDAKFAQSVVRRRAPTRGPQAIASELHALGIDRAVADEALAAFAPDRQLAMAIQMVERMYARSAGAQADLKARIGARLARRGFPTAIVRAACRAVLDDPND